MPHGNKIYIIGPTQMSKMADMPIYGKNPLKIIFSRMMSDDLKAKSALNPPVVCSADHGVGLALCCFLVYSIYEVLCFMSYLVLFCSCVFFFVVFFVLFFSVLLALRLPRLRKRELI